MVFFFSIRVFFHGHWQLAGQQGKGGNHLLFHSATFRYLFATLHSRWLSHLFAFSHFLIATLLFTRLLLDEIIHLIELLFDWLIMWCWLSFVCLLTCFYVLLQLYDMRNRWTRTCIGYHPCVTSEPTNQVCYSYSNEWLTINSFYHWQRKKFFISGNRAMFPSYTTWKYEKTISFLVFSAGIKWKHWPEMC